LIPKFQIGKLGVKLHGTPEQIHQFSGAKCENPAPFANTAPSRPRPLLLPASRGRHPAEPVQPRDPVEN